MTIKYVTAVLLFSFILITANHISAGENVEADCATWMQTEKIEKGYLDKLKRKVSEESRQAGILYSQKGLIFILGSDPEEAKNILNEKRDVIEKSDDGRINLSNAELQGFNLAGLDLANADLSKADLKGANLAGSNLRGANLGKTNLEGANLNNADLSYAYMYSAYLNNASLCGASLSYAELKDAEMEGAYLKGARLDGAKNPPEILYDYSESVLKYGLVMPE